ncbi:MAG: tetratricopeptide repeat protein [Bacteroidota bacterium]
MKKNTLYVVLLLVFVSAAGFVVLKFNRDEQKKQSTEFRLLQRKGFATQPAEWAVFNTSVNNHLATIKAKPEDIKSRIALANLFVLEGRATGNHNYYDKAALKYVDEVLVLDKNNYEALAMQALVFLSQHHFAEGLAVAQAAEKVNPYNAFLYGVLVDGYVEMGKYDSAVISAEKMMSIRPDLRSYSRVSYLREIHGDLVGAVQVMQLAIDAGVPGDEGTEWARCQLGGLYEKLGDRQKAADCYAVSLANRPAYVPGLAGEARLALAANDAPKAVTLYQQADSLVNDFTYKEELIDVYQVAGRNEEAAKLAAAVINDMDKNATAANNDASVGHYADKELAMAYLKTGNHEKALEHALAEYNRRPENIEVNELLAWVYHVKGENNKALPYLEKAMRTNSSNPVLLCRAGLIYKEAGDMTKATANLESALKDKPVLPKQLETQALAAIKSIKQG